MDLDNVVFALFHSIYDKGKYDVTSICKVNLKKREVFDIEGKPIPSKAASLDDEYVEMLGGNIREIVIHKDDMNDKSFLLGF